MGDNSSPHTDSSLLTKLPSDNTHTSTYNSIWKYVLLAAVLTAYLLLLVGITTQQTRVDFISFYQAALNYLHHTNAFGNLYAEFLQSPMVLNPNLNPPAFLLMFAKLTKFSYYHALMIWLLFSFGLSLIGALVCCLIALPWRDYKQNWPWYVVTFLCAYATLMNFSIGQMGSFLLFFVMAGYWFYLQQKDILSGFLWGIIAAIKLFPALLLVYALLQRRYIVLVTMLLTLLLLSFLPIMTNGTEVYKQYLHLLSLTSWYGDNWNASLLGLIVRIGNSLPIMVNKCIGGSLCLVYFIWFCNKIYRTHDDKQNHLAFSLTLASMLLLSPFGWMYYDSLLMLPMILIWHNGSQAITRQYQPLLWTLCLFLINAPIGYIHAKDMSQLSTQLTLYSAHFYGLVLVIYFLNQQIQFKIKKRDSNIPPPSSVPCNLNQPFALATSIAIGFMIVFINVFIAFLDPYS